MTRLVSTLHAVMLAGGLIAVSATAGFAAGDSSGSSDATKTEAPKCQDGKVWDPTVKGIFTNGKCVDAADVKTDEKKPEAEKQGLIYEQGKQLAKAGQYEDAIAMLRQAPDGNDPRVLNYLGYSHRKLGKMDAALGYYHAAVAQNPDFSLVREYLGEAYIQLGLLEKAREQLSEIERICGGRTCGEYNQLAQMIVDTQIAD